MVTISKFSMFQKMTDNGVEMVGGDSNNQGQVRERNYKVLFFILAFKCIVLQH